MTLIQPGTVIPPGGRLLNNGATAVDPALLLRAIRETMTIVQPGEILIVRLPVNMPDQVFAQYAQNVRQALDQVGVKTLLLRAEQLAVAQPAPADDGERPAS